MPETPHAAAKPTITIIYQKKVFRKAAAVK